jgi:hypothetical protein
MYSHSLLRPCKRYNVILLKLMRLWPIMRVLLVYCVRQVLPHTVYQQQQPISFSKYRPIEMSPLWRLEFWGCSYTFQNLCTLLWSHSRVHLEDNCSPMKSQTLVYLCSCIPTLNQNMMLLIPACFLHDKEKQLTRGTAMNKLAKLVLPFLLRTVVITYLLINY